MEQGLGCADSAARQHTTPRHLPVDKDGAEAGGADSAARQHTTPRHLPIDKDGAGAGGAQGSGVRIGGMRMKNGGAGNHFVPARFMPSRKGDGLSVFRDVAQSGSALAWGARGRGFKSRRPDTIRVVAYVAHGAATIRRTAWHAVCRRASPYARLSQMSVYTRDATPDLSCVARRD